MLYNQVRFFLLHCVFFFDNRNSNRKLKIFITFFFSYVQKEFYIEPLDPSLKRQPPNASMMRIMGIVCNDDNIKPTQNLAPLPTMMEQEENDSNVNSISLVDNAEDRERSFNGFENEDYTSSNSLLSVSQRGKRNRLEQRMAYNDNDNDQKDEDDEIYEIGTTLSGQISSFVGIMEEVNNHSSDEDAQIYESPSKHNVKGNSWNGLKLYVCTDHDTICPLSPSSIIIAPNIKEARKLLDKKLGSVQCKTSLERSYTLKEVDTNKPCAIILNMGEFRSS